ncbi:recombinase family protein [Frigoribacterium salinisoli]
MAEPSTRTAIYLRISMDREMDGLAIDRQRADCLTIAETRGWAVVREYVDQSRSATDKTKRRPGYDDLVSGFEAGEFDAIICWDLDRLTGQPRQLEDWIDAAEARGLRLVTANGEADLTTDGGRLFARVKAAVARSEVERKSARQSAAQAQRAAQGRAPKGMRPVGYSVAGEIIKHEAEAVRAVFTAFHGGSSLRAIAAALSGETG